VQIGRESETAALAAAIDAVRRTGAGRAVAVAGEAGLGKSRLVEELQRTAADQDMVRLLGECTPEASVPYAPFVAALRRRTRRLDNDALVALFDGPALLAATLLPEVATVVGLPPEGQRAPEDVFAGIWQALNRLAGHSGALLLLEDLHWADPDTLRLLGYVIHELEDLPVLVVGTYRPDELHRRHPLQSLLVDLTRERRLDEIRLKPLDREQARVMLSELFGGTEVGDEFLDAMYRRTEGNPFFLEELAKGLVERGDIYHDGSDWARRDISDIEIPATVRDTVLGRCSELGESAFDVLQLAAIAGDRLDPMILRRAAGLADTELDDVLRTAMQLQLLVQRDNGGGTSYAFRHALTREVFADELVGPDRRRAHLKIADALIAEYGDEDEAAAQLADHLVRSGQAARAVPYAVAAARRATRAHASDEAAARYEQALSLMSPGTRERLDLLLEAEEHTFDPLDRRRALAFGDEARALAQELGDPVAEARALDAFEQDAWHRGDLDATLALDRRALELVEGRDDWQEAWQLRIISRQLVLQDQVEEALPYIDRGFVLAGRCGHDAALAGLHGTVALFTPVGAPEWEAAIQAALLHARRAGGGSDAPTERILTNAGYMQLWAGWLRDAGTPLQEATDMCVRTRPTDLYPAAGLAWLLALVGEYDRASEVARSAFAAADEPVRIVGGTALAEVAHYRGEPADEVVAQLHADGVANGSAQRLVPALAAAARHALADSLDAAWPLFEHAIAKSTNARGGSHWLFSPDAAQALAAEGDVSRLERWVAEIRALTEADDNRHNVAAQVLCEAHLASALRDFPAARQLFEQAAEAYGAMPCPARVAEALLGLSDAEWAAGEVAASRTAAERAAEVAGAVGAHVLTARAKEAVDRGSSTTVLATVLFTDLVGSTQRAVAAGDAAWRATLERHHAVVRRELGRFGGREIDTAGDGFLATFDVPAQAIRCATAIRAALSQIDLPVRAGIHTGECQVSGEKLTGLAVHIAARVSASAGAGEVLVSRTVRDLVAGSGFAFTDRGTQELKGVPGDWQLYAVDGQ
jgi:class 3 adenylate cyclase